MDSIELTITARDHDVGNFAVHRLLPYAKRRMIGPFIFLDHMGPAQFPEGAGMDVRPHPHIGLSTVTYLFSGEINHRDSIGSNQKITPGAVNWMTSGKGIAHSERSPEESRQHAQTLHGLQSWVALPKEYEEMPPEFFHHPESMLPEFSVGSAKIKLLAGGAFGYESSVKILSPLFYMEVFLKAGESLKIPPEYNERAIYLVSGKLQIGQTEIAPVSMPVLESKTTVEVVAKEFSHFMILGGEPLPEQRFIWWNFVSTSQDRIAQAKEDWKNGRIGAVIGDTAEFIALPE